MNEIRQLCSNSSSSGEHFDEILGLFKACPPQHLLSSLSLIGQSISCMSIEQIDASMINHPLLITIRKWSDRLLQQWLINGMLNAEEYRALFYIDHLFKLINEWLNELDYRSIGENDQKFISVALKNLFLDGNFLQTYSQAIEQLINDEERSLTTAFVNVSHLTDDEDVETENQDQDDEQQQQEQQQLSPDEIHLENHSSDVQAEPADVVEVLFRFVNTIINLFHHQIFLGDQSIEKYVMPCLLNALKSPIFLQLSVEFLRLNLTREKIPIRSIFILFSSLDLLTLSSVTDSTFDLIPSIRQVLKIWNEIHSNNELELSSLIVRFIRFLHRLTVADSEFIVKENVCFYLVGHLQYFCQNPSVVDDLTSMFLIIGSTASGKLYLRQLDFLQALLPETKRHVQLWPLVSLIVTAGDLLKSSFFKRLIHLLMQRTILIFQSLASASNDTSFDSTTPSTKNQLAQIASDWLDLLRTKFLCFTSIVDEFIQSTKRNNFLNVFIDTILAVDQEEELLPKLIERLLELLWTLSLSMSNAVGEHIQKRVDLHRWLKSNVKKGKPNIRLPSQAILLLYDPMSKNSNRSSASCRSSAFPNTLISMFNADESLSQICLSIRDRVQVEKQYSVEFVMTDICQSIDSLVQLIHRSTVCLFCVSSKMKSDNLSQFIYRYCTAQSYRTLLLGIVIERDCQIDGSWINNMTLIKSHSVLRQIRRHLNPLASDRTRPSSRTSDYSSVFSQHDFRIQSDLEQQSTHSTVRLLQQWTNDDVLQWFENRQGQFDSLQPLISRLNGPSLSHLAELLALDPASMYYRLNDELVQRTESTLPLTEYVAFRSELQRLISEDSFIVEELRAAALASSSISPPTTTTTTTNTIKNIQNSTKETPLKKRRWKNSRLCILF